MMKCCVSVPSLRTELCDQTFYLYKKRDRSESITLKKNNLNKGSRPVLVMYRGMSNVITNQVQKWEWECKISFLSCLTK